MEFDSCFREDISFYSSLLLENSSNPTTFKPGFNGSKFPLAGDVSASASSPSSNQDHNSTHNATNIPFLQFSVDGSAKKDSSTCTHPFVNPYTSGFSSHLNAYVPSLSFTVPDHVQGFQTNPFWDFSQTKPSAQPLLSLPETDDQTPPPVATKVGDDVSSAELDNVDVNNNNNNNNKRFLKSKILDRAVKQTNTVKGQWTPQEDRLLVHLVSMYGAKRWTHIAKLLQVREGKQCRERWHNHLRPDIKKEPWSEEEDMILIEAHREMGTKWAEIVKRLPGRTENTIKNHWNATKRRQDTRSKAKDDNVPKPSLLQNYIKSISSNSASASMSTSPLPPQHDNLKTVFKNTNPATSTNPHLVQLENSGFNPTDWNMEVFNHQIHHQRQQQQQMDYSFDANAYNDQRNQSFGSILGNGSSNAIENFKLP